ncbi:hypothetical protein ACFSQ7_14140 [Paenibacillus rhizoplanae]
MISEGFDSCVDSRILPGQELTETTGKELILMVNEYHIAFFSNNGGWIRKPLPFEWRTS